MSKVTQTREMIVPTLMEELFLLRRRRGWSRAKVGKMLDVPERTVRSWEEGTRSPKPVVANIIRAFIDQHGK